MSADALASLKLLLAGAAEGLAENLFDLLPVGVYLCDREGRLVDYNKAASELWGWSPNLKDPAVRFCGSHRMFRLDGSPVPHESCPMAEALATGRGCRDEEIVIQRHDGSFVTALVSIAPIIDEKGEVFGAINVFRDNGEQHRNRAHLIAQRRKVEALLQAVPAAIYTTDAEGRITYYNEAAAALWGTRPTLGTGQFCGSWKLRWPDGSPMPHGESPLARALKSQQALHGVEAIAERPDGTQVPFLAFPTPLFDSAGVLEGAVSMLLDMTERQRIDARLRQSEARFRAVFDNAQVSVWEADFSGVLDFLDELRTGGISDPRAYFKTRPEALAEALRRLRLTGVNPFTLKLFEAEAEDVLLQSLDAILLPETEPALVEELAALWEGRREFEGETVLRTFKGRRIDVILAVAFKGERAEHTIVSIHDMTQRKSSEQAAQRLAAIVESSEDAIVAKDLDGTITSWNLGAERLFGYTAEEAVGRPVTMLIPEDRRDEESEILANIRRGERVAHYETLRRRKDGTQVTVSLTVSPIKAVDGSIVGASKIARDITERAEAEAQQNLLLREMNHRVKNLITLTGGLVSLSARYAQTPADLAGAVQERLQALGRAQDLILPHTHGAADADTRSTSLHALIWTIVAPYDESRGNGSRFSVAGCNTRIAGRAATSLALLLHEFATNAAKYGALSKEAGCIEIDCSEDDRTLTLAWRERGGPPVEPPAGNEGFGSVLSRVTVESQLKGSLERDWAREGLTIRLSIPRERLAP